MSKRRSTSSTSIVDSFNKVTRRSPIHSVPTLSLILLESDDDSEAPPTVIKGPEQPVTVPSHLPDNTASSLYEELASLCFPPPPLDRAEKERLLSVKTFNNKRPLTQYRTNDSVTMKNSDIQKYKDWLVVGDQGGFCKACKLFIEKMPMKPGKFLAKGWISYSRAKDIKDHETNEYHIHAMVSLGIFLSLNSGKRLPITHQLNKQLQNDLEKQKARLSAVIRALVYCARAGVGIRGHRNEALPFTDAALYYEDIILGDVNRENLMQTLEHRHQAGDKNVDTFTNKKSMHTSKDVQNELLDRIGKQIISQVAADINKAKLYSIIADETRDSSNVEQLCVAIRFYDVDRAKTTEKFLCFLPLESLKGEALATAILGALKEADIPISNCVGQAYDGTSNMSGRNSGTASYITRQNPRAIYTHCRAHVLNLSLMKSCKSLQAISNMMSVQSELCSFFSLSPKRQHKLTAIIQSHPDISANNKTRLDSLSQTRWVERYSALETTVELLPYIGECLQAMEESEDYRSDWDQCSTHLRSITSFQFLFTIYVTCQIMAATKDLCIKLQGSSMDVAEARQQIVSTWKQLTMFRDNLALYGEQWYGEVAILADALNVIPEIPRRCGRQTHRSNTPGDSPKIYYERSVTIPFLDMLVSEYERRFEVSQGVLPILHILPISVVSPEWKNKSQAWMTTVTEGLELFNELLPNPMSLKTELTTWRIHCALNAKDISGDSIAVTQARAWSVNMGLLNISMVLKLIATLPVTSCEAEKAFSKMKFLKNDLRSSMGHERLNALAVINIHRDRDIRLVEIVNGYLAARGY